jgi:hypothetical protein
MTDKWKELDKERAALPEYYTTKIPGCDDLIEGMMQGRLMRKLEDGYYEVVGYQVWNCGMLHHYNLKGERVFTLSENGCVLNDWIEHDRFDRYAYSDDDIMLFERDNILFDRASNQTSTRDETKQGIVIRNGASFIIKSYDTLQDAINDYDINSYAKTGLTVTGIVGVNAPEPAPVEKDYKQMYESLLNEVQAGIREMNEFLNKIGEVG